MYSTVHNTIRLGQEKFKHWEIQIQLTYWEKTLGNSGENKVSPMEILQNCYCMTQLGNSNAKNRSSPPEVFCSKFTGEHLCRSVISIKLLCSFIENTLRHVCSPVNLMHIFRAPFFKKHLWKFCMSFSCSPLEISLLFKWPLEFLHVLSLIPLEIPFIKIFYGGLNFHWKNLWRERWKPIRKKYRSPKPILRKKEFTEKQRENSTS